MNHQLFRKESIEHLNSPEQLDDYISVVRPSNWMILTAALVFVIGICIWGIFGRITDKLPVVVVSNDQGVYCYVEEDVWISLQDVTSVSVQGEEYSFDIKNAESIVVGDNISDYAKTVGNLMDEERVAKIALNRELPKGTYSGEIIMEAISPISYLLN